jgi:large subunit ribosomal protein L18e
MKSKTKIKKQVRRKTNQELVETILKSAKNDKWISVAQIISGSKKNRLSLNLNQIDLDAKDGETIVIPGKVLSQGEVTKKIKIVALNFSENAKDKLSRMKKDFSMLEAELKSNPEGKNIRIIRK